jgi:hypothetical protein
MGFQKKPYFLFSHAFCLIFHVFIFRQFVLKQNFTTRRYCGRSIRKNRTFRQNCFEKRAFLIGHGRTLMTSKDLFSRGHQTN